MLEIINVTVRMGIDLMVLNAYLMKKEMIEVMMIMIYLYHSIIFFLRFKQVFLIES